MYDFILFENFHWAFNHYKDVLIIAELLQSNGYKVAIADVFQEKDYCVKTGIPHIQIKAKSNFDINPSNNPIKFFAFLENSRNKHLIDSYLCKVIEEIIPYADNFYVGSYHASLSLRWLKLFPKNKNVFFWGLRSYRLYEYKLRPFSPVGINSYFLRKHIDKNDNIRFFVSDQLIRKEFLDLGICENRLIVRPERYTVATKIKQSTNPDTIFFSIGSIRENKRIELILDAFSKLKTTDYKYIIAGKASDYYESIIKNHIYSNKLIERLNYRIPEDEYVEIFEKSDFLILCDKRQHALVTNGTLNEALLNGIPVIAPNYNPYKYIIEKYHVGYLFEPDNIDSLISCILQAIKGGKDVFSSDLLNYQTKYLFINVAEEFGKSLKKITDYEHSNS